VLVRRGEWILAVASDLHILLPSPRGSLTGYELVVKFVTLYPLACCKKIQGHFTANQTQRKSHLFEDFVSRDKSRIMIIMIASYLHHVVGELGALRR